MLYAYGIVEPAKKALMSYVKNKNSVHPVFFAQFYNVQWWPPRGGWTIENIDQAMWKGRSIFAFITLKYQKTVNSQSRPLEIKTTPLTHCSWDTRTRVLGKQCRPRSDAAERGV